MAASGFAHFKRTSLTCLPEDLVFLVVEMGPLVFNDALALRWVI